MLATSAVKKKSCFCNDEEALLVHKSNYEFADYQIACLPAAAAAAASMICIFFICHVATAASVRATYNIVHIGGFLL